MSVVCQIVSNICRIFADMKDAVIPYTLPEVNDHSFFFISQHITPALEAKMHRHEAWELYYVVRGKGVRITGDTLMSFAEGDVVLIPPSMPHYWKYEESSADESGEISYLMVAFSNELITNCIKVFPEIRNILYGRTLTVEAIKYGNSSSILIKRSLKVMSGLDDLSQLSEMLKLLPVIFTTSDHTYIGKTIKVERDIRRLQEIASYVMAHYVHNITLDEIASHIGMNRSAFCTFFKRHKGITFSQFVTNYRLETARELLISTKKQISEICYAVGFRALPHFTRVFKVYYGESPSDYRKNH